MKQPARRFIDIPRRLAGGVIASLSVATLGTAVLGVVPASAATLRDATRTHTIPADSGGVRSPHATARSGGSRLPLVAPRTAPACNSAFNQVSGVNPDNWSNFIQNNALAALSPSDIWAVGAANNNNGTARGGPYQTLAERWDGSNWNLVSGPNPGDSQFWGVTAVPGATSDTNNVWAVGLARNANGIFQTLAAQYNGSAFITVNTPNAFAGGNNRLAAVTALSATNIWAVGSSRPDNNTANNNQPLIEHYDGNNWSVVTSPQANAGNGIFYAVSATGPNDVWAVGREAGGFPFAEHYDGTAWKVSTIGSGSPIGAVLYSVTALSPTSAWAAGYWIDLSGYYRTLIEQWNGTGWAELNTPNVSPGVRDNYLFSVSAISPTNVWAAGDVFAPGSNSSTSDTLVEHWDGSQWTILPSVNGQNNNFNEINAILATSATNIWAAGDYVNGPEDVTLFENLCIGPPSVSGVAPITGNNAGGTSIAISGSGFQFATGVKVGATAASSFRIDSNTQITATVPAGATGPVDVTVTNQVGTSAISPADTYIYVPPAISWLQYTLAGSDGVAWKPVDATNLSLTFTPTVASSAILSGNADLWTALAGVNQDLGILVNGGAYSNKVVAWKESGGYAGTFSPNAAFAQTVIPVSAGTAYTAELVWKSNKATSGTIVIAAGNGPAFSPSRLTAELVPTPTPNLVSAATNSQYMLTGSDGTTWRDMDANGGLTIANFSPAVSGSALVGVNADLWTAAAGVNQDVGILVSGGSFGSAGTIVTWKESGGFAGTFSPNAAYAQAAIQLAAGTQYTIKVQWKSNKPTSGTIFAAAGNTGNYSPTRLTVRLFPAGTGLIDRSSAQQYSRSGSNGSDWTPIDAAGLQLTVSPSTTSLFLLSGNVDLWTANAGVNQDVAIFVSGGAYGSGSLVAWKESGGFAGTFSPNAAFVQTLVPLASGTTYTITLEWKANQNTSGTIVAAAGNGIGGFSPTRITAQQVN